MVGYTLLLLTGQGFQQLVNLQQDVMLLVHMHGMTKYHLQLTDFAYPIVYHHSLDHLWDHMNE